MPEMDRPESEEEKDSKKKNQTFIYFSRRSFVESIMSQVSSEGSIFKLCC